MTATGKGTTRFNADLAAQSARLLAAQGQGYACELEVDDGAFRKLLQIQLPDPAVAAPPILAFKRKREIEILWEALGNQVEATTKAGITAIRQYFENSWQVKLPDAWTDDPQVLTSGEPERRLVWSLENGSVYRTSFDNPGGKPEGKPLTSGFVIRHGSSGRLYLLLAVAGQQLRLEDFQSPTEYHKAWQDKIDGVELVFDSEQEATSCYTDFEELDLRPALIQRRYEELQILQGFARSVKSNVAKVTEEMISGIVKTTMNTDELEQLQSRVLQLEIGEYDVQRQIDRLAADAGRLGYLLFMEDTPRTEKSVTLTKGQIYTTCKRTARWTETHSRGWLRKKAKVVKELVVEEYQAVEAHKDSLTAKRMEMLKNGQQVFVFEQTPSGLVSTDGITLHEVMLRCNFDEEFRRSCVVMLPVYEDSLTGTRLLTKYCIFVRPLPGIVPSMLPQLSVTESLSYRMAWKEMQLGELASTINLAPGEERTVTITKRYEQETTATRSSTSIFDISRAETADMATEMESQVRQERETSSNLEFSAKASGGYGPFSAQASASGGVKSSLKDVSQAVSNVAQKAAKSLSQQNRQEISSTSTSRTQIANTDETVSAVRNINQGRSLNLMFYRLYNKFEGGLFLDDLQFDAIAGVEVIAGSGVHESKSYSRDELADMITDLAEAGVPLAISEQDYADLLNHSIDSLLRAEYKTDGDRFRSGAEAEAPAAAERPTRSVGLLELPDLAPPSFSLGESHRDGGDEPAKSHSLAALGASLRLSTVRSKEPAVVQDLLIAAPGLYLDAVVGTQPSTEPYSEAMRLQEVRMRAAEVAVKESESAYQRAMAMRLAQMRPTDAANRLTGILPGTDQRSLTLSLSIPLPTGDWRLLVDGLEKDEVTTTDLGRHLVVFSWAAPQPWLGDENLLRRLALVDKGTSNTISYPS